MLNVAAGFAILPLNGVQRIYDKYETEEIGFRRQIEVTALIAARGPAPASYGHSVEIH
jgi:hypothetical protein